jgi:gamma-glutamyltranspeptidase/glutathione hydrolase
VVAALRAMGHTVNDAEPIWGNVQTVEWNRATNTLSGASDPRHPEGKGEARAQP